MDGWMDGGREGANCPQMYSIEQAVRCQTTLFSFPPSQAATAPQRAPSPSRLLLGPALRRDKSAVAGPRGCRPPRPPWVSRLRRPCEKSSHVPLGKRESSGGAGDWERGAGRHPPGEEGAGRGRALPPCTGCGPRRAGDAAKV